MRDFGSIPTSKGQKCRHSSCSQLQVSKAHSKMGVIHWSRYPKGKGKGEIARQGLFHRWHALKKSLVLVELCKRTEQKTRPVNGPPLAGKEIEPAKVGPLLRFPCHLLPPLRGCIKADKRHPSATCSRHPLVMVNSEKRYDGSKVMHL